MNFLNKLIEKKIQNKWLSEHINGNKIETRNLQKKNYKKTKN